MPETYRGLDVIIEIGADQIGNLTNVTLESSVSLLETTAIGHSARTRKAGLEDNSLSFTCFIDSTDPAQAALLAKGAEFAWNGYFEGNTTGQLALSGTNIVENWNVTGETENIVEIAFSTMNNDPAGITIGVVA